MIVLVGGCDVHLGMVLGVVGRHGAGVHAACGDGTVGNDAEDASRVDEDAALAC